MVARKAWVVSAAVLVGALVLGLSWRRGVRRLAVGALSPDYASDGSAMSGAEPRRLEGPSVPGNAVAASPIDVRLVRVAEGFLKPTDLKFVPGKPELAVILEKQGKARWFSLQDEARGTWLEMDVLTESEQGLLGVAFHPDFQGNGKLYLHATVAHDGEDVSEVSEWQVDEPEAFPQRAPRRKRLILRVQQPYQNHNAGQLQFGPDGMLYVGFGDGGAANDPDDNGQDPQTFLGSMLRLDVDHPAAGRAYGIPADNPFVDREGFRPEVWAYGLRNPWRYSFDPQGRMVVADVGQNRWEEVSLVQAGDNMGWNRMEGHHCFEPEDGCKRRGLALPVFEYGHEKGQSITGGYVYTADRIPALRDHYLCGDFVSGRLWALTLPETREEDTRVSTAQLLGRWSLQPVTFGRDAKGEVYVVDYGGGAVFRFEPQG